MPAAQDLIAQSHRIRAMPYGPGKMRKTWWALAAAEAGYRVLMFSGENGHGIVQRLSPAAQQRVYIIDCADGPTDGFFCTLMTVALKSGKFALNEKTRRMADRQLPDCNWFDLTQLGLETVVVIDTMSELAVSLTRRFAFENNIDLTDAKRVEWEGYRYCGAMMTWFLDQLRCVLKCHYVVVNHATQYEKYGKNPSDPMKMGPLEFSRRQPVSTSNPHGLTVSREFDHVLYFSSSNGKQVWIDTIGDAERDAGSRALPNDRYKWEDLQFANLALADGCTLPAEPAPPFDFPLIENRMAMGAQTGAPAAPATLTTPAAPPSIPATPRPSLIKR